jgi:hypothetical protein
MEQFFVLLAGTRRKGDSNSQGFKGEEKNKDCPNSADLSQFLIQSQKIMFKIHFVNTLTNVWDGKRECESLTTTGQVVLT